MTRKLPFLLLTSLAVCGSAFPAAAQNAGAIRARTSAYKQLGAAFKTYNDTVRRGDPAAPALRQAAGQIANAARNQYQWFPANSRAAPGVKTAALPEIWAKAAEFKAAQDAFAREAGALARVSASGDMAAIRSQARKLGGACKSCHDRFREESD